MNFEVNSSMTKNLVVTNPHEKMGVAYSRMKNRGVRHLPVVDYNQRVVGIISDRDFQRAMQSRIVEKDSYKVEALEFDPEASVEDYMSSPVVTVSEDTEIKTVAELMIREKISSLLVLNDRTLVGIVTYEDLLKILVMVLSEGPEPGRLRLVEPGRNPFFEYFGNTVCA